MTVNRHPLQAQGAGQAQRRLPDDAVVPYCNQLAERLVWVGKVLHEEQREGHLSSAAAKGTEQFLQELRATVMVMALKHGRQLLGVEPLPLTIDPTESGMPTFKDFWTLREDHEHAPEQVKQLPDREQLLEQATEAIFRGERPARQQVQWLELAYLSRLATTPVIADFQVGDPVLVGEERGSKTYALTWTNLIRSLNLFETTTLHFIERSGWYLNSGKELLGRIMREFEAGRHTLQEMIGMANQAGLVVPQTIERVTIGPYFHPWTQNDPIMLSAFAATGELSTAWLFRASIERAATTKASERSMMDSLFGREPVEAGPSVRSAVVLVPLAIKQQLGDRDEDGNPAAVYGLSNSGDLVY